MRTGKEGTGLCKIKSKGKVGRDSEIRGERKGRGGVALEAAGSSGSGEAGRAPAHTEPGLCQALEIKVRPQGTAG